MLGLVLDDGWGSGVFLSVYLSSIPSISLFGIAYLFIYLYIIHQSINLQSQTDRPVQVSCVYGVEWGKKWKD